MLTWSSLGFPPHTTIVSGPSVGVNVDGRLEVFVGGGDGNVWHIWQTTAGGAWSNWTSLGSPYHSSGQLIPPVSPIVSVNLDGRLEVFVCDSKLWHIWQTTAGGAWSNWTSLDAPPNIGLSTQVAARGNHDGRLEVFAIGRDDGNTWHIWQNTPGGAWSDWASLGAPPNYNLAQDPIQLVVEANSDGRLEVFVVDDFLWHVWQNTPGGAWSDWASPSHPPHLGLDYNFSVGVNLGGRLEVFAFGADITLWHMSQKTPGEPWGDWTSLGKPQNLYAPSPLAVARNLDGRLDVFFVPGLLSHIGQVTPQITPGGAWSTWTSLDAPPGEPYVPLNTSLAAARNLDGRLEVFVPDTTGILWHILQVNPGDWGN